ncbi:cryptococcal mannosyltransferase 1-domain-containing protein [Aspergillus pseudoustus]|uniref:Cryptococcal mannosyltransferase 1-domain-containing protein n=1 Tax=Aspergillus pseudoustus TaxID=1810923 RepID=A0ABR4KKS5_9EURO
MPGDQARAVREEQAGFFQNYEILSSRLLSSLAPGLVLINLLGEDNVFLSIYESDSGEAGRIALETQVRCSSSVVYEDHLDLQRLPKITIPAGAERIKLIQPLDKPAAQYDKILFMNDVAFDPLDETTITSSLRRGLYQPFQLYDTYATRNLEGYSMGLPFSPWFSGSGSRQSRKPVLAGKDAVPVRSCWGGMVAFDAQLFQPRDSSVEVAGPELPARFRALQDVGLFWDASECFVIHADIQTPRHTASETTDTGVYMNPFKLYSMIHNAGNHLVGLPWFNPRRDEVPGQSVKDTVFLQNGNKVDSFQNVDRNTTHDGFCGRKGLQIIVPRHEGGQKGWKSVPIPV